MEADSENELVISDKDRDIINGLTWALTVVYVAGSTAAALQFYRIDRHFSSWVRQKKVFALLGASLLMSVAGDEPSTAVFLLDQFAGLILVMAVSAQLMQWSTAFHIVSDNYEGERKKLRRLLGALVAGFVMLFLIVIILYPSNKGDAQQNVLFGGNIVFSLLLLCVGIVLGYCIMKASKIIQHTAISPHIRSKQRQKLMYFGSSLSVIMVVRSVLLLALAGEYFQESETVLNDALTYGTFLLCYYILLDLYPIAMLLVHNRHVPVVMMSVQPQFKFETSPLQGSDTRQQYGTLS